MIQAKRLTTIEKLNLISEYQAQQSILQLERQRIIDEAMPAEVKARIAEINAEFNGKDEAVSENIKALEKQVKEEVIESGESLKGAFLHAIYAKGRVTWDGKMLEGMMSIIPGLKDARKEGEPSVSLRKI